MNYLLRGWERNPDGKADEIAAANRALVGGERQVWDANYAYRMALARGNPTEIHEAELRLKEAMTTDILRKGGRLEDVLMVHSHFGQTDKKTAWNNWLIPLGLAALLYYFTK